MAGQISTGQRRCHCNLSARLSANVRKGADVLSETLADDSRETRIGLSAAARKAAQTFAKMPGSKVIKHAQAHRHMTASADVLHGWDENGDNVIVNIALLGIKPEELMVEGRDAQGGTDAEG